MRRAAEIQPKGLEPGIYFGLSDEIYFKDPALNYSSMKALLQSEINYWAESVLNPNWTPRPRTDEMKFGTMVHCMLFEPAQFDDRYQVATTGKFDSTKETIRRTTYEEAQRLVAGVRSVQLLEAVMSDNGLGEVVVIWDDPDTGLRCKAKHDFFHPSWSVDYKTVDSVNEQAIKRAWNNYGYHIQYYHYVESRIQIRQMLKGGTAKIFGRVGAVVAKEFMESGEDGFLYVFQAKKAPSPIEIMRGDPITLHKGRCDARDAMALLADALETYGTGNWPICRGIIREFNPVYGFSR